MHSTALSFVQNFLKRQYGLNCIVLWSEFSKKTISVESYCHLVKNLLKDNVGWTILSFCQDFWITQYELNHIVFWSKFLKRQRGLNHITIRWKLWKRRIWVEPYHHLINVFQKNNVGWTILSLGQKFLKRQYGLNHIVFRSKFS